MPHREIVSSLMDRSDSELLFDALDAWTQLTALSTSVSDFVFRTRMSVTLDRHRVELNRRRTHLEQQDLPSSSHCQIDKNEEEGSEGKHRNKRICLSNHVKAATFRDDKEENCGTTAVAAPPKPIETVGGVETVATNSSDAGGNVTSVTSGTVVEPNEKGNNSDFLRQDRAGTSPALDDDIQKLRRIAQLILRIEAANAKFRDEILDTILDAERTTGGFDSTVDDDSLPVSESE